MSERPNGAETGLNVDVSVAEPRWVAMLPDVIFLCRAAAQAAFGGGCTMAIEGMEASILLTDDAQVRDLNKSYRQRVAATNVLSFPGAEFHNGVAGALSNGPVLLGDVVVALETLEAESARDGKPLKDHLCHMIVHGMLHLLGYDHQTAPEAQRMETLEVEVLTHLGIPDPYATSAAPSAAEPERQISP